MDIERYLSEGSSNNKIFCLVDGVVWTYCRYCGWHKV